MDGFSETLPQFNLPVKMGSCWSGMNQLKMKYYLAIYS